MQIQLMCALSPVAPDLASQHIQAELALTETCAGSGHHQSGQGGSCSYSRSTGGASPCWDRWWVSGGGYSSMGLRGVKRKESAPGWGEVGFAMEKTSYSTPL